MNKLQNKTTYFFVDESGDPTFYDRKGRLIVGKEGCSKVILLGFIRTESPESIRKEISKLQLEIADDKYLLAIPSIKKTLRGFHAKDDSPEIREKFFKLIVTLDFKAEFVVARKIEDVFIKRHKRSEDVFYDDLVAKLFQNKLHVSRKNLIYYAVRGSRKRQVPIANAVQTAVLAFEEKWKTTVDAEISIQPQSPVGDPCLQVIDYMNWAVYRAFTKSEDRYLKFVEEKISYLGDIYDFDKYPKNFYNSKNKFNLTKISPL